MSTLSMADALRGPQARAPGGADAALAALERDVKAQESLAALYGPEFMGLFRVERALGGRLFRNRLSRSIVGG